MDHLGAIGVLFSRSTYVPLGDEEATLRAGSSAVQLVGSSHIAGNISLLLGRSVTSYLVSLATHSRTLSASLFECFTLQRYFWTKKSESAGGKRRQKHSVGLGITYAIRRCKYNISTWGFYDSFADLLPFKAK